MSFSKVTQTPDSNSSDAVLIAVWLELVAYYLSPITGNVWSYHRSTGGWSNCGNVEEFRASFTTQYRGKMIEA